MTNTNYTDQELLQRLQVHNQSHVLQFWEQLAPTEQQSLAQQVRSLNLPLIEKLYQARHEVSDRDNLASRISLPSAYRWGHGNARISAESARNAGQQALRAGAVGVVIVAGGQGTRLGFPHPKGQFPIGQVSGASLLQILIEKARAVSIRYNAPLPVYLMTSPATHDKTLNFVEKHQRFGLAANDLRTFCQGVMPAVDTTTGQLLLAKQSTLALNPDGHGGMLAALRRHGIMDEMQHRGIKFLFYAQIDNPLVPIADPEIIGYHLLAASEATSLAIRKRDPLEKVGNFVLVDDRLEVIEYSDLPEELATMRNEDGSLKLWAGSIAVHVFNTELLERMAETETDLPFHCAQKKVPFVDSQNRLVEPAAPNAIKFERFIFDLLPIARHSIVVEADRQEVFAPVKNASGASHDSPDSVMQQMNNLYRSWLKTAGCLVKEKVALEISPLYANNAEELKSRISPDMKITTDTYLS